MAFALLTECGTAFLPSLPWAACSSFKLTVAIASGRSSKTYDAGPMLSNVSAVLCYGLPRARICNWGFPILSYDDSSALGLVLSQVEHFQAPNLFSTK